MSISLIPDTAPFNTEQRAWLNGFLAGWIGLQEVVPSVSAPPETSKPAEDFPWHDAALSLDDRLKLAENRPIERKLMAAMAQLDCGSCGYECQSYAEAIASGDEKSLTLCSPGGTETAKTLKTLLKGTEIRSGHNRRPKSIESGWSRTNPYTAKVVRSVNLNGRDSKKATYHVEIDLGSSGLTYEVGDALGVYPTNCPDLVRDVITALGENAASSVTLESRGAMRFDEALTNFLCLGNHPESLLETLANAAQLPEEGARLRAMMDDDAELIGLDVLDLLLRFPSARPSAADFAASLSPLKPRLYSISSSPRMNPRHVHLTVGKVTFHAGDRLRKGVASTMFADRLADMDSVRVFVHKSRGFTVPADPNAPMIMIGPGTGIAPFRAFLQERESIGANGMNWLFYGDQRSQSDFLYESELKKYLQSGLLSRLDTAFSRDQEQKIYVQHRMIEQGAELFRWLEEGGCVFVCGDAKHMAADVHNALLEVVSTHGRRDKTEARDYVATLTESGRYHRDVY